jgi:hypothetical protein
MSLCYRGKSLSYLISDLQILNIGADLHNLARPFFSEHIWEGGNVSARFLLIDIDMIEPCIRNLGHDIIWSWWVVCALESMFVHAVRFRCDYANEFGVHWRHDVLTVRVLKV